MHRQGPAPGPPPPWGVEKVPGIRPSDALNCGEDVDIVPDADVAAYLKQAINRLKSSGIDTETGHVNYRQLGESESFRSIHASRSRRIPVTRPPESVTNPILGFSIAAVSRARKYGSAGSAGRSRTPFRHAPRRDRRTSSPASSVICNRPCDRNGREFVSGPGGSE